MTIRLRAFWRAQRGAAAAEFALVLTLLIIPLLNAADFGIWIYQGMELNEAAQVAAQAAWVTCGNARKLPATVNCAGLSGAVTTAAQSTSLGSGVSISSPSENYYCVNGRALVVVGTFPGTKPPTCLGIGPVVTTDEPGDYIQITASYSYHPLFTAVSLAGLLPTPITKTVWMRLG